MVMQSQTETNNSKELAKSNDTPFGEKWGVVLLRDILLPLFIGVVGTVFTLSQFEITNSRQDADNADQEREAKEQVLTDYGKAMQELFVERNPLLFDEKPDQVNGAQTDLARGYTLIALSRLNVTIQKDEQNWLSKLSQSTGLTQKVDANESKVVSGRLKALVIRYLYEAELIGFTSLDQGNRKKIESLVYLGGADLRHVNLGNAWLPGINLQKAELNEAQFVKADLTEANLIEANLIKANLTNANLSFANLRGTDLSGAILTGANLENAIYDANTKLPEGITDQQKAKMIKIEPGTVLDGKNLQNQNLSNADLRGADLRRANLTGATLTNTNLTGACYVEGTEADFFPAGFNPKAHGMKPIPEDKSDSSDPANFEPCPPVSSSLTP